MNIKGSYALIAGIAILVIGGVIFYFVAGTLHKPTDIVADEDDITTTKNDDRPQRGLFTLKEELCAQSDGPAHICAASAISAFPDTIIRDTHTGGDCVISYDPNVGFHFKGNRKSGIVAAGDITVTTSPSGDPVTLARSANRSISLHVGSDGMVDHILFVAEDFTSEQCLTLGE